MAEKKPLWGKKGKYKPVTYHPPTGEPMFAWKADDLIKSIKSERKGFERTVIVSKNQSKKYADLIARAKAEGVEVNVAKRGTYKDREYDYKSVGSTNVKGGFANNERGQAAQAKFESLGGKVVSPNKKKMGNIIAPPKSSQVAEDRSTFARFYGVYSAPGKPANKGKRFRRG
jgi:wyosine [tRNA(Phe)-imidazoG37] synthetase (radical SAM superfamily)